MRATLASTCSGVSGFFGSGARGGLGRRGRRGNRKYSGGFTLSAQHIGRTVRPASGVAAAGSTIFVCRAVAHQHAARRGNRSPVSSTIPSTRPTCGLSALSATISAGRAKASRRPRLRAGTVSASLPLRSPLGESGEQADQAHEQVPHQHIQHPGDAVPGAARVEPGAQFFPQDGKTLGRGWGMDFHVCQEYMPIPSRLQGKNPPPSPRHFYFVFTADRPGDPGHPAMPATLLMAADACGHPRNQRTMSALMRRHRPSLQPAIHGSDARQAAL
jgi:hypothetical protein